MRKWAILAILLWSGSAWALEVECPAAGSNGDRVGKLAGTTETAGFEASQGYQVASNWLTCNSGAATVEFDTSRQWGAASQYIVSLEDIGTCTGVDITIGFRSNTGGRIHTVGTLSLATDSLVINGPRNRFIVAVINTMAGCGDAADVRLDSFIPRRSTTP